MLLFFVFRIFGSAIKYNLQHLENMKEHNNVMLYV